MELGQCSICGKLCIKNASGICPECFQEQEENEKIISDYVKLHEQCSIDDIEAATGISLKKVKRIIKSGRILLGQNVLYPCEWCGELISRGKLCEKCTMSFSQDARQAVKKLKNTPEFLKLQEEQFNKLMAEEKKAKEEAGFRVHRGMYSRAAEERRRNR